MIVESSKYFIVKNEILNLFIEFTEKIDKVLIIRVFILINKYYPSYLINKIDFINMASGKKWEDVILEDLKITSEHDLSIHLSIPLYYPFGDNFSTVCKGIIADSMKIYYGFDNTLNKSFFAINFFANVYTNRVSYWKTDTDFMKINSKYINFDITEVATKNRAVMKSFLIELESLLDGEITEYLSHHIDQKYLNKYGINEDAVLIV